LIDFTLELGDGFAMFSNLGEVEVYQTSLRNSAVTVREVYAALEPEMLLQ